MTRSGRWVRLWSLSRDADGLAHLLLGAALVFTVIAQGLVLYPLSAHLGEVTVPWLMQHGRVLYSTIFEHRPPLSAWTVYTVQPLFGGDTLLTARALNLLTSLLTLLLIYAVAKRLGGSPLVGGLAALYYAALQSVFVNILFYFEMIQGLLYLAAVWLLIREQAGRAAYLAAGVLFGLAFLTKQQAILPAAFGVVWVYAVSRSYQKVLWLGVGMAAPVLLLWGLYAAAGLWHDYFFWNFTFNARYSGDFAPNFDGDFVRRLLVAQGWMISFGLLALKAEYRRAYSLVLGLGLLALIMQLPRAGEIHAAAGLPLVAVMFGVVVMPLVERLPRWRTWQPDTVIAGGLVLVLLAAIGTNVLTSYVPSAAGFRAILGYDELRGVGDWLRQNAAEGDTLYVFPEGDSTAQLHPITGLLPPHTWSIGWRWVLTPPFVVETLLEEWTAAPPTWLVVFPDLEDGGFPAPAAALRAFVEAHYAVVQRWEAVPFYGQAVVLHLRAS